MEAAENRASQGGKPANEEAYYLYVTEIRRRSQRRKQNCKAILRLRDFFGGLRGKCGNTFPPAGYCKVYACGTASGGPPTGGSPETGTSCSIILRNSSPLIFSLSYRYLAT